MRRYIITGAPGAGKTTIVAALRDRGFAVVEEAATDVNLDFHALGRPTPWQHEEFIDTITRLQRQRLEAPAPAGTEVQVFDRSPVCTLALANYLGLPVTAALAEEVDRTVAAGTYERTVFFVQLLGFVTPTDVRRITYEQSVAFARFHEEVYRGHGFELVDVPAGTVQERVELIEQYLRP